MNSLYLIAAGILYVERARTASRLRGLQIMHKPTLSCRGAYKKALKLYDGDAILID